MSREKIERNLRIVIHLAEGAREEREAERNKIRQPAIHLIAERTIRKLIDNEQVNYLSVRGAIINQPEIAELAKAALERVQQLKQRRIKLPHKLTPEIFQTIKNL